MGPVACKIGRAQSKTILKKGEFMALVISHPGASKKIGPSKLIVGVLVASMTAFVGLGGVAGATSDMPPSQWCKDHSFKNHGQCVSAWKQLHNPGHGYGGGNVDIDTNIDLTVVGNNNTINIIINYILGSNNN